MFLTKPPTNYIHVTYELSLLAPTKRSCKVRFNQTSKVLKVWDMRVDIFNPTGITLGNMIDAYKYTPERCTTGFWFSVAQTEGVEYYTGHELRMQKIARDIKRERSRSQKGKEEVKSRHDRVLQELKWRFELLETQNMSCEMIEPRDFRTHPAYQGKWDRWMDKAWPVIAPIFSRAIEDWKKRLS